MTLDRYQAVDFSVPYFLSSYCFTLKIPPPPPQWLAIRYPFSGTTWLSFIVVLLILSFILHLLIMGKSTSIYYYKADIVSTVIYMMRALLNQGVSRLPEMIWVRPFMMSWWLVGLIIMWSFTGNLIAFLTVPMQSTRLKTVQDIALSGKRITCADYGLHVPESLKTSANVYERTIGERLELFWYYEEMRDVMDLGGAFIEGTEYMEYLLITWGRSDCYITEEKIYSVYNGWIFPKGSILTNKFNWYIQRLVESGLSEYWRLKTTTKFRKEYNLKPESKSESTARPLSLKDLQSSFIILAFGIFISASAFILELVITKCSRNKDY